LKIQAAVCGEILIGSAVKDRIYFYKNKMGEKSYTESH